MVTKYKLARSGKFNDAFNHFIFDQNITTENEAYERALTSILNPSGINLFKADSSGNLKKLDVETKKDSNNNNIYTNKDCK